MNAKTAAHTAHAIKVGIVGASIVLVAFAVHVRFETAIVVEKQQAAAPRVAPPYTFPNGGRSLVPKYRLIALYGTPNIPALGALGQQPPDAAIARIKQIAASYQPYMTEHVLPTLEIITTIASSSPTDNGDYSQELDVADIQPWITAARKAGVYVVLDLQSGRANFLLQAEQYASLLKQPNVGLALDPEWRLGPAQVPLEQIGTVNIDEVNAVDAWLAQLTAQAHSPQKLFLLHQFQVSMIAGRQALDTSHRDLAYVIQMDGQGTQPMKRQTWQAITANPPPNVAFGWKNFYVKDSPMLDPADTMAITPKPRYVSFQ